MPEVHFRDCVEASLRLIMTTGLSDGDMERLVHDIWKVPNGAPRDGKCVLQCVEYDPHYGKRVGATSADCCAELLLLETLSHTALVYNCLCKITVLNRKFVKW